MRAYLVALALTALVVGVPLVFAGYVGVGCTATGSGANAAVSNCAGASGLELVGGIISAMGGIFLAVSLVPEQRSGYR